MMKQWLVNLYQDEEGASAIEYALIVAIIAIGILAGLQGVRDQLIALFARVVTVLTI